VFVISGQSGHLDGFHMRAQALEIHEIHTSDECFDAPAGFLEIVAEFS
jgi:hypothetical protein